MNIEQEIQAKSTAPRVTLIDIEANIASELYLSPGDGDYFAFLCAHTGARGLALPDALRLLTFCVLVLKNGFTVTGESACASPENFDAEIGRKIARANAVQKMWPLMGYELRTKLSTEASVEQAEVDDMEGRRIVAIERNLYTMDLRVKLQDGTVETLPSAFGQIGGPSIGDILPLKVKLQAPGLALDSGEFIPAAEIQHHRV